MLPEPILLSREQIDAPSWDQFISQSRQCVIYAKSWYLDIVCERWEALVWPSASHISIAVPLPVRRKFGQRVLYQPLFCQYLGIFSKQGLSVEELQIISRAIADRYGYISCYAFNPDNAALLLANAAVLSAFECEISYTHWLDLRQEYAAVFNRYSRDRKHNLRRGEKAQWKVAAFNDFTPLIQLFKAHHAPGIGRIHRDAYCVLERLGKCCLKNAAGMLLYAQVREHIHAGALIVQDGGRAIYLFNAADCIGRKGHARAGMLDSWFRENAGNAVVFDFESPAKQSIADYYKGFGAAPVPYYCIKRNALLFPFRQMQRLRQRLVLKTKQYPFSSLCRILNPFRATRF
ncbi:hypothetical protein [Dyadobacter beijingensis]|uniref:hypothetical protein n=1 Tax=Dyadobacter beijingensis TaxID=365489 RepID=UPI0012F958DF|nr:hypothetical protein [Dyadobacter beijingensis]